MSAFTCRAGKTLDHKRFSVYIISYLPTYFKYTRCRRRRRRIHGPPFNFPLGLPFLLLFVSHNPTLTYTIQSLRLISKVYIV